MCSKNTTEEASGDHSVHPTLVKGSVSVTIHPASPSAMEEAALELALPSEKPSAAAEQTADPMAGGVENGIEYQSMSWWQAGMVMVAETVSLGILSLPHAMATVGAIPGLILLLSLGLLASYSGYVIGQFKLRYPQIHTMACAGEILFGKWGGVVIGWCQYLFYIFVMGSHILTFSICMNAITGHGACTIVWMVVGTVLSLACTLPRTLKHMSYYCVASFISIVAAVMVTIVAVAITKPGMQHHRHSSPTSSSFRLWPADDLSFLAGFLAVSNMVFAYAGHVAFFTFISELRNPRDFPKALAFLQVSDICMYLVTTVVIYYYAGAQVASPALNSASQVVAKVAWGLAIPTIVIAGVVNGHVGAKYMYVRFLRGRADGLMHQRSWRAWRVWLAMCALSWLGAWLVAEAVPVFSDMLAITSALFASWFTFGLSGMFWFRMNLRRQQAAGAPWYRLVSRAGPWSWKKSLLLLLNFVLVAMALVLCVVGLYASISSMAEHGATKKPFSCAA